MAHFINRLKYSIKSSALIAIISANVAIYLVLAIIGLFAGNGSNLWSPWLCISSSTAHFVTTPWTLFTYMFVQYNFLHLLFNMMWLFWFGKIMLDMLPGKKLVFSYLTGGVLGGVFYILANLAFGASFQGSYLCGSSGAVLSVMACIAALYPNISLNLFLFGEVRLKWIVVVCAILTFLGVGGDPMAISAHIGGLLAGIGMAASIKGIFISKSRKTFPSFKRKETIKPRRTTKTSDIKVENVTRAMQNRLSDADRLDQLLDKIRESGYASLTDTERKELNAISANLDKKRQNSIS